MNPSISALMLSNLVIGSGSLVIAGILSPISQELDVSVATAGQLSTAYALAFAIGAPLASFFLGAWCRKRVLMLGLGLFALASLIGALAPSYGVLLASRLLAGVAAAMVSPTAAAVAAMLSAPEQRGRAIATVFGGFTLATVFGVPLGSYLGLHLGWRETLAGMAAASALMTFVIAYALPANLQLPRVDLRGWLALGSDSRVLTMLAVSLMQIAGTYAVFSFIGPFLAGQMKTSADQIALLLMLFGVAGFLGNWLSGRFVDKLGAAFVANINIAGVMAGLLLIALSGGAVLWMLVGIAIWGGSVFSINTAQQARLVAHAPQSMGALLPANSSVLFAGQALGGIAGGLALSWGSQTASFSILPWLGLAFATVALLLSYQLARLGRLLVKT
jgi:predicted MFS family arabinose efflux permease